MSLSINFSWRKILTWSIFGIAVVLFLVYFIRIVVWEDAYYHEKEGSERATVKIAAAVEQPVVEELIEEEPTEEEVREYYVDPDRPRYLSIPKLGINNARIRPVGINEDGTLGTPRNVFDVGWYESSGLPGEGKTMLIDGHNGGPHVYGVFKRLPDLEIGDTISVWRGDGVKFHFAVKENVEIPLDQSSDYMATAMRSPEPGKESITLITCTGEWSQAQGTYLSRQFVRATLYMTTVE